MADLVIRNGYVLTMDRDRRILGDGAVAIAGSRIVAVGPTAEILAAHRADHVIDATDQDRHAGHRRRPQPPVLLPVRRRRRRT